MTLKCTRQTIMEMLALSVGILSAAAGRLFDTRKIRTTTYVASVLDSLSVTPPFLCKISCNATVTSGQLRSDGTGSFWHVKRLYSISKQAHRHREGEEERTHIVEFQRPLRIISDLSPPKEWLSVFVDYPHQP